MCVQLNLPYNDDDDEVVINSETVHNVKPATLWAMLHETCTCVYGDVLTTMLKGQVLA